MLLGREGRGRERKGKERKRKEMEGKYIYLTKCRLFSERGPKEVVEADAEGEDPRGVRKKEEVNKKEGVIFSWTVLLLRLHSS